VLGVLHCWAGVICSPCGGPAGAHVVFILLCCSTTVLHADPRPPEQPGVSTHIPVTGEAISSVRLFGTAGWIVGRFFFFFFFF